VVDEDEALGDADLLHQGQRPLGAALLVAVRRVDEDGQAQVLGQLHLRREHLLLLIRDLVVADLADAHHAVLVQEAREDLEHAVGELGIVGLLGVQRERADVRDAELARAETLPADQTGEVVNEAPHAGARLPLPERRLEHDGDAGGGHLLVVVRRPRRHVNVRVEDLHGQTPVFSDFCILYT
jgi:hypothetical protein